jgi:hypothetical protein
MTETLQRHARATGYATPTPSPRRNRDAHAPGCTCPVCTGLQTFVRPRFFAGQLLTDAELGALTAYVADKQRLHNLHLHGWGVVCGLQVDCDDCGPDVLVRPGYAIDPCGSDIVVPETASVDVMRLIMQCQAADRAPNCDPPRIPDARGCDEAEETWCLTVRYREQERRPVVPLGGAGASSCGCGGAKASNGSSATAGCDCGGSRAGWECTCGGGRSRETTTCGCASAPRPSNRPADCEPSRTYELYDFGVCRANGSCHDLGERLAGTFPMKVAECIRAIQPVVSRRMTSSMQRSAGSLLLGGSAGLSVDTAREAICTLYQNVLDLYRKDPMRTMCVLPEQLREIDCSPQEEGETDSHYQNRLVGSLQALVILVLLYLRDCVCYHVLPPCPDAPCDDRVVLACLTVKDQRVVSICNQDCRRYAGSFVSREYWLPIGPVLSWLAGLICCFPLLEQYRRLGTRYRLAFGRRTGYERLRSAVHRDDFAIVELWRHRLRQLLKRIRPGTVLDRAEADLERRHDEVHLATYLHRPVEEASSALARRGVRAEPVEVTDWWEVPVDDLLPTVPRGGVARLYVSDGRVVGVGMAAAKEPGTRPARSSRPTRRPRQGDAP